MNLPSDATVRYYDDHCDRYVRETVGVDMESLYAPFFQLLPKGAKILDAGCGSGRDTKAFLERGFEVTSMDASARMVDATRRLTGVAAKKMLFQELDFEAAFDGVWACASLLHVPRREIDDVLDRIIRAIRPEGICYLSVKQGDSERLQGARRFTDYTKSGLETCLAGHRKIEIIRVWITADLQGRDERWVNALVKKNPVVFGQ